MIFGGDCGGAGTFVGFCAVCFMLSLFVYILCHGDISERLSVALRIRDGGRTMSRFNTDCLCPACAEAEKYHPRYREAVEAELAEIRKGNYNFKGIGYKP